MKVSGLYKIECYILEELTATLIKNVKYLFSAILLISVARLSLSHSHCSFNFRSGTLHQAAIATAISLAISHIPVQILKRWYPRKRPYLTIQDAKYPVHPLQDHSFPSGHTTAVFSVFIPFICYNPNLLIFLLPLALCVGISRIYLGLHYPSDVFVGMCLGTCSGIISFINSSHFSHKGVI